jgi:tetratricopeptide (TPR) repeat protein
MARISRKELKRDEFLEATKEAENWLEQNWRLVLQYVAAAAIVGIAIGGWFWYAKNNRERASELLSEGLATYQTVEAGGFADTTTLETALTSFDGAASKGGNAPVGLVAEYYRGVTLHRLGQDDDAIEALTRVAENATVSLSLSGSASAMLATVYAARGEQEQAIGVLQGLIDADPPVYPIDQALLELAELCTASGETASAQAALNRIIDEFPASPAATEARQRGGS